MQNLKLVILLGYQSIKAFLQKAMYQIGLEKFLLFKKVKITVLWTYVISDLKSEEIIGTFYEKELLKTKKFRVKKVINKKGDKLCVKWKGYNSSCNSWIDKKETVLISEYIPKPNFLGANVKLELDLSNYATKADLKNAKGVDTSSFATDLAKLKSNVDKLDIDKLKNAPTNLNNLKSKVDKLDVDKLVPVPVDLSKISEVVKNDVVKKTEHRVS